MPVTISVSDVRNALYRAEGLAKGQGLGSASTALLGKWFHEGLSVLVGDPSSAGPLARLAELDGNLDLWKQSLVSDLYCRSVGPRMTQAQATLHPDVEQVQAFWQAIQAACGWVAELSWELRSHRPSRRVQQGTPAPWQTLAELCMTEQPLVCELREPSWSDSVRLVGIVDAIVRLARGGAWCAIEFKLGRTSPAVDLAQACLYHLMLSRSEVARAGVAGVPIDELGTLAVVSFHPERQERLFGAEELSTARTRLIDLVGSLAGVSGTASEPLLGSSDAGAPAIPLPPSVERKPVPTEAHQELGRRLVAALAEYGVNVSIDESPIPGPTFVRFPITLSRGTKVKSVNQLAPEIQVRLRLKAEPFIALDDGRQVIDLQRPDRETVDFDEILPELIGYRSPLGSSRIPVGVDLFRRLVCADLAQPEHSHFLVAGTTGSGKSEWLRMAIAGLIAANTPETLRLVVIDPKRNAFHPLRESPFLWKPIVFPDEQSAVDVLMELAEEMDRRYRMFSGADSLQQLVERSGQTLPRIVCICDEYRDLISRDRTERKRIEDQVCRLGAKARAAGIHLILATQEPSRDTIRGPLDSNIPARVGLMMGKSVESRMLLNQSGAERLLGHGDLLFKDIGDPRRLQAPLLSEANRNELFGKNVNPYGSKS